MANNSPVLALLARILSPGEVPIESGEGGWHRRDRL